MVGVPSIEERIKQAQRNADVYKRELDKAIRNIDRYQGCLNKELSRVGELTLLKDVRDGKLLVLDRESMEPARIAFL
jgi:hypothetical protein|nr:MAG TPA: adhesin protein [Caudoviricetes sp.]